MDVPEADGEREIRIKETNKQTIYKKYSWLIKKLKKLDTRVHAILR
jgi:hypothetical protein